MFFIRGLLSNQINEDGFRKKMKGSCAVEGTVIEAVQQLYAADPRIILSVSVTGGGVQLMQMLYTVPGASRCLMDAQIPYARSALRAQLSSLSNTDSLVGAVNDETAIAMALCARRRAVELFLAEDGDLAVLQQADVLGLACTAALVSGSPKKGLHRCHVACATGQGVHTYAVTLEKGRRTRVEEDEVCSHLLLDALLDRVPSVRGIAGVPLTLSRRLLVGEGELVQQGEVASLDSLDKLYAGKAKQVMFRLKPSAQESVLGDAAVSIDSFDCVEDVVLPVGTVVYAGSFRPLHRGHVQLAQAALSDSLVRQATTAAAASPKSPILVFEISAINADKPPLAREEVLQRVFALLTSLPADLTNAAVCVTSEPLFVGKASLFRGCTFALGADTMIRLLDSKYYGQRDVTEAGGGEKQQGQGMAQNCALVAALATLAACNIRFIVGGREQARPAGSHFLSCEDILRMPQCAPIPQHLQSMFHGIAESCFREDISSTQIRRELEARK